MEQAKASALGPYRVLDLTDDKGFLCGKILADLGADVIKVEPPGGEPARHRGPFYQDIPHPERSLYWFAYNTNKRGITLNLQAAQGRDMLRRLARGADFLLESFPPGHLDSLGLGYEALSQINPRLIVTSITPFGQSGPCRDWKAPDIVAMALGGLTYVSGDPSRPPVRISYPQAHLFAGAYAAVGSLVAHHHRQARGEGQQVDVSVQQCCAWTSFHVPEYWDMVGINLKRAGMWRQYGHVLMRVLYPCRDGFISMSVTGGAATPQGFFRLLAWMEGEGMLGQLKGFDFRGWSASTATMEEARLVSDTFARFIETKTKEEVFRAALEMGFFAAPVSNARDLWQNEHLRARGFWVELEHPELGVSIPYPGPFVYMSRTPVTLRRRAPLIGEHNEEIYHGEMGLGREELASLKEKGVI